MFAHTQKTLLCRERHDDHQLRVVLPNRFDEKVGVLFAVVNHENVSELLFCHFHFGDGTIPHCRECTGANPNPNVRNRCIFWRASIDGLAGCLSP
jgi:hypothetical protein